MSVDFPQFIIYLSLNRKRPAKMMTQAPCETSQSGTTTVAFENLGGAFPEQCCMQELVLVARRF